MATRSNRSLLRQRRNRDSPTSFWTRSRPSGLDQREYQRKIPAHDAWLKKKRTDGISWYDIITDTLDENWHDDDDIEFAYDPE